MSKSLSSALGLDMTEVAQLLRKSGRGKDTVLAHITPKEAALLKRRGGRGSINPKTGLPEFGEYDDIPTVDLTQQTDNSAPVGGGGGSGGGSSDSVPMTNPSFTDAQAQQFMGTYTPDANGLQNFNAPQTPVAPQGGVAPAPSADASYDSFGNPVQQGSAAATSADVMSPNAPASQFQDYNAPPAASPAAGGGAQQGSGSGWLPELAAALGTTVAGLTKAGVLGGTAALGAVQGQQSAAQGQAAANSIGALSPQAVQQGNVASTALANLAAATAQAGNATAQTIQSVGQPIKDIGTQMMTAAQGGALTPADLQALDILRARGLQGMSNRGGVGAMQEGVTEANARSTMGQNELNQGIATYNQGAQYDMAAAQVQLAQQNLASQYYSSAISTTLAQANISDQYTVNAIMLALQNDQVTAQNLQKLYASLASIAFGGGGNGSVTINASPTSGS